MVSYAFDFDGVLYSHGKWYPTALTLLRQLCGQRNLTLYLTSHNPQARHLLESVRLWSCFRGQAPYHLSKAGMLEWLREHYQVTVSTVTLFEDNSSEASAARKEGWKVVTVNPDLGLQPSDLPTTFQKTK